MLRETDRVTHLVKQGFKRDVPSSSSPHRAGVRWQAFPRDALLMPRPAAALCGPSCSTPVPINLVIAKRDRGRHASLTSQSSPRSADQGACGHRAGSDPRLR